MPEYKWKPIDGIPDYLLNYADEELGELFSRWQETRKEFDPAVEKEFLERLKREWAIETGQIENLYKLTRGITDTLIEKGISPSYIKHSDFNPSPEEVADFIKDQHEVVEGLFDFVGNRNRRLSKSYICEMHQVFTKHQNTTRAYNPETKQMVDIPLLKGQWKKWPNSPRQQDDNTIHEYAPPEQVESEMDSLISLHTEYDNGEISPEVHAAWLHHAFTQIHPFQDGNGRIARALASIIFIKHGMYPLLVKDEQRSEYIDALEAADFGNLHPLVELFSESQKDSLVDAIEFGQDIQIKQELEVKPSSDLSQNEEFLSKYQEAEKLLEEFRKITVVELTITQEILNGRSSDDNVMGFYKVQLYPSKLNLSSIPFNNTSWELFRTKGEFSYLLMTETTEKRLFMLDCYCLSVDKIPHCIETSVIYLNRSIPDTRYLLEKPTRINLLDYREWIKTTLSTHLSEFASRTL